MSFSARAVALVMLAWVALAAVATADDWIVDRLRGEVLVQSGSGWHSLARGDVVSDSSAIRSLDGSRVTFQRGVERIELNGATEIRIFDRVGEKMTTIMQAYGEVTVEAERRNIQHFSVQTPYLAAIVKGTRFTVLSNDGQSSVEVSRGLVQVQDYVHDMATDILPGQTAVVAEEVALQVTGNGARAPVVTLEGLVIPDRGAGRGNGAVSPGNSGNTPAAINRSNGGGRPENVDRGNHGNGAENNNGNGSGGAGNSGNTPAAGHGGNDNSERGNDGRGAANDHGHGSSDHSENAQAAAAGDAGDNGRGGRG